MRIRWTLPAADDLEAIKNYLQQQFPHFAEPTVRTIYRRIRSLATAPNRGRPGLRKGTRELVLLPLLHRGLCGEIGSNRNTSHPSRFARLAALS